MMVSSVNTWNTHTVNVIEKMLVLYSPRFGLTQFSVTSIERDLVLS